MLSYFPFAGLGRVLGSGRLYCKRRSKQRVGADSISNWFRRNHQRYFTTALIWLLFLVKSFSCFVFPDGPSTDKDSEEKKKESASSSQNSPEAREERCLILHKYTNNLTQCKLGKLGTLNYLVQICHI